MGKRCKQKKGTEVTLTGGKGPSDEIMKLVMTLRLASTNINTICDMLVDTETLDPMKLFVRFEFVRLQFSTLEKFMPALKSLFEDKGKEGLKQMEAEKKEALYKLLFAGVKTKDPYLN